MDPNKGRQIRGERIIPEQIIESFVEIATDLSKNPSSNGAILRTCATELCKVCKELLLSVENLKRWFNRFSYFIFDTESIKYIQEDFFKLVSEYKTLKESDIRELSISIKTIENLDYKLNEELRRENYLERDELRSLELVVKPITSFPARNGNVFPGADLVSHVTLNVIAALDRYIEDLEPIVEIKDYGRAERQRLYFKKETKNLYKEIERLEENFTELVERFARYSLVTICLSRATTN